MLGLRLCVLHNLYYYNNLMTTIRSAIRNGNWAETKNTLLKDLDILNK